MGLCKVGNKSMDRSLGFPAPVLPLALSFVMMAGIVESWVALPMAATPSHRGPACLPPRASLRTRQGVVLGGPQLRMSAEQGGGDEQRRISHTEFLDDLLCQRAVQTQLDYFEEFRDGHKKGWLESYKGKDGIAKIHAFGQLENGKQYLKDMLNEPPVTHTVEISWGNRHNVGSKDNPFIKREKEMYTETLHPQKIVQFIMDIRQQLVAEWIDDLALLGEDDYTFLQEVEELREGTNTTEKNDERSSNLILSHCRAASRVSTPLRARNYDLIKKAGTFITIRRMLESDGKGEDMSWFSTWYAVNGEKLEGNSGMRESENLLRNLMTQPMRSVSKGDSLSMIDPTKIAKEIMAGRADLIDEWVEWLESGAVQDGHTELMRSLVSDSFSSPSKKGSDGSTY